MRIIGITGGIGAGKTEVLSILKESCHCRVLLADEAGHLVKQKGQPGYRALVELLGKGILAPDQNIDKGKMAEMIFGNEELLKKVNELLHPAVERFILDEIERERETGKLPLFFVEAALLLDSALRFCMDEIWYVYAEEQVRRKRLKKARNYSDERIDAVFKSQRTEEEFRKASSVIIYNNGDIEETKKQIEGKLGEYL